jgi:coproporphyrinogen III oxidase-like Fe-S oxidoreductase
MGLRLTEGVDLVAIAARTGIAVEQLIDDRAVADLARHGLLRRDADRLVIEDAGMLLLDAILPKVVAVSG